ncbi:MAG: UDP-2,3-diacylglucosamine diphosphatase LpxI, partial [Deltaproteobacteria bacterium]|nr:UDP-2,3-diacylglucosamine diphosphatase LpxI [Deltaproteobacteria bacterium]
MAGKIAGLVPGSNTTLLFPVFLEQNGVRPDAVTVINVDPPSKERLFRPWRLLAFLPDWRMLKLWFFRVRNRQDHTLLAAVADEFERSGIPVAHSTKYCPELLAEEGVLTRRGPTKAQLADIRFGWRVAKRMADLDVGQSVAVSERATLSVEGIEGTDRNIRRAGELCRRGGFTVVKLAKEGHDMRFDVPAIG